MIKRFYGRANGTVRGMILLIISGALFAGMHGSIRLISGGGTGTEGMHPFEIAFFRNFFGLVIVVPLLMKSGLRGLRTTRFPPHAARARPPKGAAARHPQASAAQHTQGTVARHTQGSAARRTAHAAPRPDEILYALVMATGPRVHARIGGLAALDIVGDDGLR